MFSGGIVTVFVSDLDKAVRFYTEALGLKLGFRFGNEWASIKAGDSLVIGLHPASRDSPAGRKGSITLGLQLTEPIQKAVPLLKKRGVKFRGSIVEDKGIWFAYFENPDGNELYLADLNQAYENHAAGATTR